MYKFRKTNVIISPLDWENVAGDIITDFLSDFTKRDGLTRKPNKNDKFMAKWEGNFKYMIQV